MMTGDADFNYRALEAMFRACLLHFPRERRVRTGRMGSLFRSTLPGLLASRKAADYRGYFSMEMDRQGDPYAGTQKLIDMSLQYLA